MVTRFTKQEHQNVIISKDLEQELKISNNHFFPICVKEWYKSGTNRHNFMDALSPICDCDSETKTRDQLFLALFVF